MKIATSPVLVSRYMMRGTLYVPENMPVPPPVDQKGLVKAAAAVALKNASSLGIAYQSWHLTTVPNADSPKDLIDWLVTNNVPHDKAPAYANDLRSLLSNPLVRSVLFAVCGASVTYVVMEKTAYSQAVKWSVTVGVGLAVLAAYFFLRHYGVIH